MKTLKELRDNIASTVRESGQATLIDSFINLTIHEIHNYHVWTWLRRKQTFSTVASQEDYTLDEEVDRIALIRQIAVPHKLMYVPDRLFYKLISDPESLSTGVPYYYRLWEETGFSTNLAAADTIYISSSSASDTSSFTVRIVGRNSSGEIIAETLALNGITAVTSTNTFAANGLMQVSKSAATTGTITVYRTTGATVLSELPPDERAPRFKKVSFYPIPSEAVTTYIEYYERPRLLVHDSDTPQLDHKWNWVIREGTLAKMWEYKQNEQSFAAHLAIYTNGLKMMKEQDMVNMDYIPVIEARFNDYSTIVRVSDSVNNNFPSYAVRY